MFRECSNFSVKIKMFHFFQTISFKCKMTQCNQFVQSALLKRLKFVIK